MNFLPWLSHGNQHICLLTCNNLSPSAFTIFGSLNNTRQIQELRTHIRNKCQKVQAKNVHTTIQALFKSSKAHISDKNAPQIPSKYTNTSEHHLEYISKTGLFPERIPNSVFLSCPHLDLGTFVADDPRHGGEGGELIGSHLWVHARQVTQQRGLAHWREAHKPDTGVTSLCHVETYRGQRLKERLEEGLW